MTFEGSWQKHILHIFTYLALLAHKHMLEHILAFWGKIEKIIKL